jgi:phosphatidylglycerophosphate synthase
VQATAFLVGPVPPGEADEVPVARQLRALGYDVVDTPADTPDSEAGLLDAVHDADPGPVAIVDRRYIGHLHVLRQILRDQRYDASSGPGVVAVSAKGRDQLLDVLPVAGLDVVRLADELSDHTDVRFVEAAPFVAGLADTEDDLEALQARMSTVDEEKLRLKNAVKSDDTMFTTFAVRTYSGYVARWLARLGVTPNQVTIFSLLVAVGAAAVCTTGSRLGYVLGALLFHLSFALDCIDGDLARYSLRYTRLGAFLDATFDRLKEYALYAGLAIGSLNGGVDVWWLAAAAMALQTVRHQMHFAYEEVTAGPGEAPPLSAELQSKLSGSRMKVWLRRAAVLPQGERSALLCLLIIFTTPQITFVVMLIAGLLAGAYGFLGRLLRSLKRLHRGWSRRAATSLGAMVDVGPIGWIVHRSLPGRSLPAPLATLIGLAVLVFALAAAAYDSETWRAWVWVGVLWYVLSISFASRQPLNGWADWVLPPSYRAAEYGTAILLITYLEPAALPAAFAYVAACAYHHYDTVYRLRGSGTAPPKWLVIATGGHDLRMLVLALLAMVAAAAGGGVMAIGLSVLAIYLVVLFVGESAAHTVSWIRAESAVPGGGVVEGHEVLRAPDEAGDDRASKPTGEADELKRGKTGDMG